MPTTTTLPLLVPGAPPQSFLRDLIVRHGPVPVLARALLAADAAADDLGISIEFASFEELVKVNNTNLDSWRPLLPHYDPSKSEITPENAICLFGRNKAGDVVVTQVARYFDWHDTNLHDELTSLRLFYRDPAKMRQANEAAYVTAPTATKITGRVAFTGGLWCRPDYRGKGLVAITPRIARALAVADWNVDFVCTIMAPEVHARGVAGRGGFPNVEWEVSLVNNPFGTIRMALLWIDRAGVIADLEAFSTEPRVQNSIATARRT
jgi:hypothetical protein